MPGPLEGTKVVELGFWVAGPATAGILSDWGASVVKIEPPRGDPFRGIFMSAVGIDVPFNPPFELDNRGKRSVDAGLELEKHGFTNVANVLEGFEGELDAEHHRGNLGGWRKNGLPWRQV